jgi:uncharacterized protein (TIGR02678 family)
VSVERLADALSSSRADERVRSLRALLMRPLMTAADPEFPAVRRHADFLRDWVSRQTGWVLAVERDCARLYKRPVDTTDGSRGIEGFDRRRYVLLCLACAMLERAEPQVTLRALGDRLLELAADPKLEELGFRFRLDHVQERRELVHVCRFLLEIGVLHRVAGDEESYVQHGGDALYDVQRRALAGMLACSRGPSTFGASAPATVEERLAALVDEHRAEGEEGRRTAVRHGLVRRLLDDPVTYFDELTEEERDYFANQRGVMGERLRLATGLVAEQRAEGMALIDPEGELSDAALPAEGTTAHATLLVAQYLAEQLRHDPQRRVAESEIAVLLRGAADQYGRYWRKAACEPGAEAELAREALGRLHALKLVRWTEGVVVARPALARFAVEAPAVRAAPSTMALL